MQGIDRFKMFKNFFFIILFLSLSFGINATQSLAQSRLSIGDQHTVYSDILEQDRRILVGLPRNYTEDKNYPVLYLLDGEEYYQMAQGILDFLHNRANNIPEVILVAIPNIYRNTDLTPAYEPNDPNARTVEQSGGANQFIKFLKHELQPFIIDRYSTSGNNILFGHSLAGLFAAHTFLEDPSLFNHYVISDPSLWYGEGMLIRKIAANKTSLYALRKTIYLTQIDRSNDEDDIMSKPQDDFMAQLSGVTNIASSKILIPNESHDTVPLKSLYQGLLSIFKEYEHPQ